MRYMMIVRSCPEFEAEPQLDQDPGVMAACHETREWRRRFPNPLREGAEAVAGARELCELDDFAPGDTLECFEAIDATNRR